MKFFDPHFHVYNWKTGPHSEELWKNLYPSKEIFGIKDYEALVLGGNAPVELIGGVFIEACAEPANRIAEAEWVNGELNDSKLDYGIVSGIDLA